MINIPSRTPLHLAELRGLALAGRLGTRTGAGAAVQRVRPEALGNRRFRRGSGSLGG